MTAWLAVYIDALATVSALLALVSVVLALLGQRVLATIALLSLGAGGLAVFWERWSARAGEHMSLLALLHPVPLTDAELFLLATHAPFFVAGLAALRARRSAEP